MNDGRIVARGSVEAIREEHGRTEYRVYTSVPVEGAVRENGTYCRTVESIDAVEETGKLAENAGGEVEDIQTRTPSLEDIFLELAAESPDVEGRP
jgi:ABC-2 type transport system ATP-binding protein